MQQLSTLQIIGYLLGSGFLGSILTMIITRILDSKKEERSRKFWIFRALVTNIQNRFNYDFVSAINLINIDFHNNKKVIFAWERFLETIKLKSSTPTEEEAKAGLKEIDDAIANLIKIIGADLGYDRDKFDILNKSYIPSLWQKDNLQIRKKEDLLIEILESKRSLNINLINSNPLTDSALQSKASSTLPQGESD